MMNMEFNETQGEILCCLCGTPIPPNPSNMCMQCICTQVDITDGIQKQCIILQCRNCGSFLNPPNHWHECELESTELLTLCLKRVRGLQKTKLVDASFIWTEPHSKRIKLKVTIQKEVLNGTILQSSFVVEFIVQGQQCERCQKVMAKNTWTSVCQLRQKSPFKRSIFFLEQLIIKNNVHAQVVNISEEPDGLDFYFSNISHARRFHEFVSNVLPTRMKTSNKLISTDLNNNTTSTKNSISIEIAPICRNDLVCLPKKLSSNLGHLGPLLLCYKVSNVLHFIDTLTLRHGDIQSYTFWKTPFHAIMGPKELVEFTILDCIPSEETFGKFRLADVQVARTNDFGKIFDCTTHLGNLFNPGDYALGYDLSTSNINDSELSSMKGNIPDIILVRKIYKNKKKKRNWKLKRLTSQPSLSNQKKQHSNVNTMEEDYEGFLQEVEVDSELRSHMNVYKDSDSNLDGEGEDLQIEEEDPSFPEVELLDPME